MNDGQQMMENAYTCLQSQDLSHLDERKLMLLFHQQIWKRMNKEMRLQTLQEVENRRAKADGRPPVKIIVVPGMEPNLYGGHGRLPDGREFICLNHRFLTAGKLFSKTDTSIYNGASALNTVLHEGRHAFQSHAVLDEFASVAKKVRLEWAAVMPDAKGLYNDQDPIIYMMQSIEMDARRFARRKIAQINQFFNSIGAPDPNFNLQVIRDIQRETLVISRVRATMTREMIDKYEEKVVEHFKQTHPEIDLKGLGLFDHVRFILDHPEIKDPKEMLERLDKMADEKMALRDGQRLNRFKNPGLNAMKG